MGDKSITSNKSTSSTGEHTAIEVVAGPGPPVGTIVVGSIKAKLGLTARLRHDSSSSNSAYCSICRVPEKLRNVNNSAYTPEIVSIGPFHHNMAAEHKLRYVADFLEKTGVKLEDCVESVCWIELEARSCYSESNIAQGSINTREDFVEVMVIDGLFFIELLHKAIGRTEVISRDDPFLANRQKLPSLARDVILLENQIPACVVDVLHKLISPLSLWECALTFIAPLLPIPIPTEDYYFKRAAPNEPQPKHLLDRLYSMLVSSMVELYRNEGRAAAPRPSSSNRRIINKYASRTTSTWKLVPNVKELRWAGVKLKLSRGNNCFLDIRFRGNRSCCLEIPHITIQDGTESLLQNLIAYEQTVVCSTTETSSSNYIASYAVLMDCLVNSVEDVELLMQQGIITSELDDNMKIVQLFSKLSSEIVLEELGSSYSDLCAEINSFCTGKWRVWRAHVKRDILNDRRAIVTFFLGVVLTLILSLLQTVYTILSYYDDDATAKKK